MAFEKMFRGICRLAIMNSTMIVPSNRHADATNEHRYTSNNIDFHSTIWEHFCGRRFIK